MRALVRLGAAAMLVLAVVGDAEAARKRTRKAPTPNRQQATARPDRALYDSAAASLASLKKSPSRQGRRGEWEAVALKFRKVVDRYPKSSWCDDALLNVGNLYREMADRFDNARYRAEAIKSYRWIVAEYPASRLGERALFAVYELGRDSASKDKTAEAAKAYLAAYPRGPHAAALRDTLRKRAPEKVASLPDPPPPGTSEVFDLREWGGDSSVRVVLDLDRMVELHHGRRDDDKDRLVVGLSGARLHPNLADRDLKRDAGLLRGARLVSKTAKDVDLVLDFANLDSYTVFYLQNPLRLVIDAQAAASAPPLVASIPTPAPSVAPAPPPPPPLPEPAQPPRGIDSAVDLLPSAPAPAAATPTLPLPSSDAGEDTVLTSEDQHRVVQAAPSPAPSAPPSPAPGVVVDRRKHPVHLKKEEPKQPEIKPTPAPTPEPTPEPVVEKVTDSKPRVSASPSAPPQTNRDGSYSLARQLGLKARKIVIDAGHGGHDPGTIGHGGLQEKDLVLDVALRLEKRLREELGVEVVMTRDKDEFVELVERTAIANSGNADLFLSIHANSSRSRKARGIETYYLNFAGTPHAESVAARENAASAATMKDLQGLVKTIMLNTKIPESRDFAAAVQESMVDNVRSVSPETPDRGVHTAPFYVLIGATMPSVLAEIAFVSHPDEERLLKKSDFRDTIAESLLGGVRSYLGTLPAGSLMTGSNVLPPSRARSKR